MFVFNPTVWRTAGAGKKEKERPGSPVFHATTRTSLWYSIRHRMTQVVYTAISRLGQRSKQRKMKLIAALAG